MPGREASGGTLHRASVPSREHLSGKTQRISWSGQEMDLGGRGESGFRRAKEKALNRDLLPHQRGPLKSQHSSFH